MNSYTGSIVIQLLWSASLLWTLHGVIGDFSDIDMGEEVYQVGQDLQFNCTPQSTNDYTGYDYTWLKDSVLQRRNEKDSPTVLYVANATEDDFGEYLCKITAQGVDVGTMTWHAMAQPVPQYVNITEGEKLVLQCAVRGKPDSCVSWTHERDDVKAGSGRAELSASSAGVPNGKLVLINVTRSDAGLYSCRMRNVTANTTVYVADLVVDQDLDRTTPDQGLTSLASAISDAPASRERVAPPRSGGGVRATRGGVLAVAGSLCLATCLALYLHCRFNTPH